MPLIFQKWISRSDLHANPDILYVFGDNLERRGRGGQAKEMRGEPNAVGVVTKRKASHDESAYLTDADFDEIAPVIRKDFARVQKHLQRGGIAVIPSDGLGTGLSQLQTRAPNTLKFLEYVVYSLLKSHSPVCTEASSDNTSTGITLASFSD